MVTIPVGLQLREIPGLAERMAALMCVDIDLNSADEEAGDVEGGAGEEDSSKLSAAEIMRTEMCKVKEGWDDTRWLELEELDIDDDMFVSLDLPDKCPGTDNINYLELHDDNDKRLPDSSIGNGDSIEALRRPSSKPQAQIIGLPCEIKKMI
ncbi:hypothetical protein CQW23_05777 [Capsicum baccatum]|uniref:Uncharacterized protein n=1 Tax=Capsicum baccatum TaxID=33114 RepID=A0A2G2XIW7_CAPBA|nr:hypothetical protein CQW23_05777 [Capsicum baccatum]